MVDQFTGTGTFTHIEGKHRLQKRTKGICLGRLEKILLTHDAMERPWLEVFDIAQCPRMVKELAAISPPLLN